MMRYAVMALLAIMAGMTANIVATAAEPTEEKVYTDVEEPAMFPGGDQGLMKYLATNIRYPAAAQENGASGTVIVKFVVNKDGMISDVEIVKGVDQDLDREALRVVRRMPKWQPGKNNGQPVKSIITLPVSFRLS